MCTPLHAPPASRGCLRKRLEIPVGLVALYYLSADQQGNVAGSGDLGAQVRQAYTNVKEVLAQFHLLGVVRLKPTSL